MKDETEFKNLHLGAKKILSELADHKPYEQLARDLEAFFVLAATRYGTSAFRRFEFLVLMELIMRLENASQGYGLMPTLPIFEMRSMSSLIMDIGRWQMAEITEYPDIPLDMLKEHLLLIGNWVMEVKLPDNPFKDTMRWQEDWDFLRGHQTDDKPDENSPQSELAAIWYNLALNAPKTLKTDLR